MRKASTNNQEHDVQGCGRMFSEALAAFRESQAAAYALISGWTTEDHNYLRAEVPRSALRTPFRGGTLQDLAKQVRGCHPGVMVDSSRNSSSRRRRAAGPGQAAGCKVGVLGLGLLGRVRALGGRWKAEAFAAYSYLLHAVWRLTMFEANWLL